MPALAESELASPQASPHAGASVKRKRSTSAVAEDGKTASSSAVMSPSEVGNSIELLWSILQSQYDTKPSILARLTAPPSSAFRSNGNTLSAKRARLMTPAAGSPTIERRVTELAYTTFEEFVEDVDEALRLAVEASQADDTDVEGKTWKQIVDQIGHERFVSTTMILKDQTRKLVSRSRSLHECKHASSGAKEQKAKGIQSSTSRPTDSRTVLTLYGNAAGHKQLFSSLQRSGSLVDDEADGATTFAISEKDLPIGISTTEILQTGLQGAATRPCAFQDLFAPPASLPPLQLPKISKASANRNSITWSRGPAGEPSSRHGYADEQLATGRWLGYAGVVQEEASSPQARRRQRDRALSMSTRETGRASDDGTIAAQLHAKEDALFRSAYSTFAPSQDNTAAIVPEQTKNSIWWQRHGNEYFHQTFGASLGSAPLVSDTEQDPLFDEETDFKQAVEDFVPESLDELEEKKPSVADGEELLRECAELIETLYSHQRVRMLSSTPHPRMTSAYGVGPRDGPAGPSVPSWAEAETHKSLKAQLALMIGTLPPYMVSKLNGEQLDELSISRHLPIENRDYRGIMEEDAASRRAKMQAFQAAVGQAPASRPPATSTPSNSARGALPRTLAQASQTVPRASTFGRQALSAWQSPGNNAAATIQRPSYANPHLSGLSRPIGSGSLGVNKYPQAASARTYQLNGGPMTPSSMSAAASPRNPVPRPLSSKQQQQQQQQNAQRASPAAAPTTQSLPGASPLARPISAMTNGMSRSQTPASPAMGMPSPAPQASMAPTLMGVSGTPQPAVVVSKTETG